MIDHLSRRDWLRAVGAAGLGIAAAPAVASARPQRIAPSRSAASNAGFYRTTAGSIEVTIVTDGGISLAPVHPTIGVDQPADVVQAAADEFAIPDDAFNHVNCVVVRSPDGLVLIDTGVGPAFGPTAGRLQENLAAAGFKPEDIDAVLLTHAHVDHIGGLASGFPQPGGKPLFRNASVYLMDEERRFWLDGAPDLSGQPIPDEMRRTLAAAAQAALGAVKDKLESMGEGRPPARGIEVLPLPGHTPGHCGLIIGDGADRILFTGDTIMMVPIGPLHPEWQLAFDTDGAMGRRTRQSLYERLVSERLRIAGPHIPFPSLGHMRRRRGDSGYEFLAEAWRW